MRSVFYSPAILVTLKPLRYMKLKNTQQMENLIQQIVQSCDEFSMRKDR